ncbi:hypothetical protein DPM19_09670 [Actinomadura craniellae]|uniref:Histidine kinase/HSP90-like ATPase domain-containing protein n=1 Tax=Actinomadura craniellae TaxID=2231787 RepID=A0A365H7I8_9ACTN|nr:ATP-binding protein [Actinomadura craniellae]RAY15009.1 hypothetical protein DPM19_09670 [Actinomadura craniellae]
MARSLLGRTMAGLGLDREVIEDGRLAVSETATNALRHARPAPGAAPPELWIWARTVPAPQLVVSVFDGARTALPRPGKADLLEESGKGLALLGELTAGWGHAPSRSLLAERPTAGKTVWFTLPLPPTWPSQAITVRPDTAARCLLRVLARRGLPGRHTSHTSGLSLLELPALNVWICPGHFSWQPRPGLLVRHPLIDLQETAEHLIRHLDGPPGPASTP